MKLRSILATIIFVLTLLSFCRLSFADGIILPEVRRKLPDIPVQRAIVKYHEGIETLIIEPTLEGEGHRFGWIIPVPNIPERFEKISPGLLKTLSFQLQPEIKHKTRSIRVFGVNILFIFVVLVTFSFIFGVRFGMIQGFFLFLFLLLFFVFFIIPNFLAYRGGPGSSPIVKPSISIESRQIIGNYEIFVLKAKVVADLNTWLKDNEFRTLPEKALPIIDDYIKQKWCFIAAKLVREYEGTATPHPVLIEFITNTPVYPMRLTSLPGSNLNLELFVIAEQEAVPVGYMLKKDYCNFFDKRTRTQKAFVGRKYFFGRNRIGHPDARKIMWNGCVVTKLVSEISSTEMKQDIFFKFEKAKPFRSVVYSRESAHKFALERACIAFMIGFPILTVFYKWMLSYKLRSKGNKMEYFIKLLSILLFVCIVISTWSYVMWEKIDVVSFPRGFTREWQSFTRSIELLLAKAKDTELMEQLEDEHFRNPFTKHPVILEDSPGNITVVSENGMIVEIKLYRRDGSPYNPYESLGVDAYNNRGLAWYDKEDYDRAIDDYNKALKINPLFADAYNNRGLAWNNKGDYDRAIADYNKALEINPRDAEAYNNRGLAWHNKGNYDRAIDDYSIALDINPRDPETYKNRACSYYQKACKLGDCNELNWAKKNGYCQ